MKNNEIVKSLTNNPLIILIIGYFFLGGIIYSTWVYSDNAAISFLGIITNSNYLVIFVFVGFYLYGALVYNKLNNPSIVIRFKTRMQYLKYIVNTSIKATSIIYIYYIIIIVICLNILGMTNYSIQELSYATNLYFLIIGLIKLYFYLILLQLLAITTFIAFKTSTFAAIFNLGIYLVIYMLKYFTDNAGFIINSLNPQAYLVNASMYFNNWQSNILASIIFIIFYLTIIILIMNKVIKNSDFLEKE